MIPFLKRKDDVSVTAQPDKIQRKPDDEAEEDYDGLAAVSEELCEAIHAKDYKSVAIALRAAFQILDLEPHKEGEHL